MPRTHSLCSLWSGLEKCSSQALICRTYASTANRNRRGLKDHYQILGVSQSASAEEIKKAFFEMSKKHHPDLLGANDDPARSEKFLDVKNAYELLKDEEKRTEYDRALLAIKQKNRGPPFSYEKSQQESQRRQWSRTGTITTTTMSDARAYIVRLLMTPNPAVERMREEKHWQRRKIFMAVFLLFIVTYFILVRAYYGRLGHK